MSSVSRTNGVSPTASVSYPPPGTVNKGSSVSDGGTGPPAGSLTNDSGTLVLTDDTGTNILTKA